MSVDLKTRYLGLELKNPVVVAACSLNDSVDKMKQFDEAGAAAVVLPSLFEEQIEHEQVQTQGVYEHGAESFAESLSYFPELDDYRSGPETYLEKIGRAKQTLSIPVIASINGTTNGGWVRYAKQMQEAGADALELNIYHIAADVTKTGAQVEQQYCDLVGEVKQSVSIPLAVKLGPHFSSPGNMVLRIAEAGADGLVLFNRFLQPNIDLEELEISPRLQLSTKHELLLPLRWIAITRGHTQASLAHSSGIHSAKGMLKSLLVGADVGMIASVLYEKGPTVIGSILEGMKKWMTEKDYASVEQLKGSMSQANCPDPTAFERGNYMKALTSFTGEFI